MFKLLKNYIDFRNFFLGQSISQIGDRIHSLALIWIVYKWTGSTAAVGGILIATTLPSVLISPFAGAVSDRTDKRIIMITADCIRGVLVCLLAYLAYKNILNYTLLISATIVISLASAFFNPSALAIIPDLVDKEHLTKANAMNQLSGAASSVLGPLFGSLLIAAIGVPMAFLCNGISFFISMFFILRVRFKSVISKGENILNDMIEGFKIILKNPFIKKLMLPIIIVNFFFSSISIIIPKMADGIFAKGASGMGYMMSAFGLGMLMGIIFLSNSKKLPSTLKLLVINFIIMGGAFFSMGVIMKFNFSLFTLFLIGFSLNIINIILIVLFQKMLEANIRGKVMALITATALSLQPISYGVTGIVLDVLKSSAVLVICGIIIISCGCYIFGIKELKNI